MTIRLGVLTRLAQSYLVPAHSDRPEPDPTSPWKVLDNVNDWVRHGETKGALTLAGTGVSAGVLFNLVKDRQHPAVWLSIFSTGSAVLLVLAGVTAIASLWPRLRSKEQPTNLLYFNHIARKYKGPDPYAKDLRALLKSPEEEFDQVAQQIWANAGVANRRFKFQNVALAALASAVVLLGATAAYVALNSIGVIGG